jgi:hypothetical protein
MQAAKVHRGAREQRGAEARACGWSPAAPMPAPRPAPVAAAVPAPVWWCVPDARDRSPARAPAPLSQAVGARCAHACHKQSQLSSSCERRERSPAPPCTAVHRPCRGQGRCRKRRGLIAAERSPGRGPAWQPRARGAAARAVPNPNPSSQAGRPPAPHPRGWSGRRTGPTRPSRWSGRRPARPWTRPAGCPDAPCRSPGRGCQTRPRRRLRRAARASGSARLAARPLQTRAAQRVVSMHCVRTPLLHADRAALGAARCGRPHSSHWSAGSALLRLRRARARAPPKPALAAEGLSWLT